jgi:integrase
VEQGKADRGQSHPYDPNTFGRSGQSFRSKVALATSRCSNLAIDSKLRGCDVVAIRVEDVAAGGYTADRATVRQKKTGRPVRFELSEQTRQAVDDYLRASGKRPGEFLFTGRRGPGRSMTTRQCARLVSEWIGSVGLDPRLFGTHSLRRTKATLIYRRTVNLRAVQLLLGHTKIESTVRYLGIEVDDALATNKLMSEIPGQSGHALPASNRRFVPQPEVRHHADSARQLCRNNGASDRK